MYDKVKNTIHYIVKLLIYRKRHSDESQNLRFSFFKTDLESSSEPALNLIQG